MQNYVKRVLTELVSKLTNIQALPSSVIDWASPIPSFGDISKSKIATVGLNPSNLEFVDQNGNELNDAHRRFHTLKSLHLDYWDQANEKHLLSILDLCNNYFHRNPYDAWFKKLDYLVSGSQLSYYFPSFQACHLDLVPFCTSIKWADIIEIDKKRLLKLSGDSLGVLIRDSPIEAIILNGKSVVDNFRNVSQNQLKESRMPQWTLPRKTGPGVMGYAYEGIIKHVGNIELKNKVKVFGFNHNIQSSFGVTSNVQTSIRNWITQSLNNVRI